MGIRKNNKDIRNDTKCRKHTCNDNAEGKKCTTWINMSSRPVASFSGWWRGESFLDGVNESTRRNIDLSSAQCQKGAKIKNVGGP